MQPKDEVSLPGVVMGTLQLPSPRSHCGFTALCKAKTQSTQFHFCVTHLHGRGGPTSVHATDSCISHSALGGWLAACPAPCTAALVCTPCQYIQGLAWHLHATICFGHAFPAGLPCCTIFQLHAQALPCLLIYHLHATMSPCSAAQQVCSFLITSPAYASFALLAASSVPVSLVHCTAPDGSFLPAER